MEFILKSTKRDSNMKIFRNTEETSTNNPSYADGYILSNKYVIIGTISFFVLLFVIAIFYHLIRAYGIRCCHKNEPSELYANLTAAASEDEDLDDDLDDDLDYNNLSRLYVSCQLCVEDAEVNTSSTSVNMEAEDCDFEYDCSSLSNSVVGLEESQSLTNENVLTRSFSEQISSKFPLILGRRFSRQS